MAKLIKNNLTALRQDFKNGLLIIHDDLDGRSCEILGKLYMPQKFDYLIIGAWQTDEVLKKHLNEDVYDLIIIADLCFKEKETLDLVNSFISKGNQFFAVDHHDDSLAYKDNDWAYVSDKIDEEKNSGAELLYHFFNIQLSCEKSELANYIELVRLYDTWDWKKENNLDAIYLCWLFEVDRDQFVQNMISKFQNNHEMLSKEDILAINIIKAKNDAYINKTIKRKEVMNYDGLNIAICVANQLEGFIADRILDLEEDIDMVVFINSLRSLSFRSRDCGVDTLKYSRSLGGGGHKSASGCGLKEDLRNYILSNLLN